MDVLRRWLAEAHEAPSEVEVLSRQFGILALDGPADETKVRGLNKGMKEGGKGKAKAREK
jgi:hypothetical protein